MAGTCIKSAIEPVLEIGKSITALTEDTTETMSLFQWISSAPKVECSCLFLSSFDTSYICIIHHHGCCFA